MRSTIAAAGCIFVASMLLNATAVAWADPQADQASACAQQADKKGLQGADRDSFVKTCQQGALATTKPTEPAARTPAQKALTEPSGADRNVRSRQCTAEENRRGLTANKRRAFRLACLASAAPVRAVETSTSPTAPTPAKSGLDTLPR